jgi:hypothetical protein
MVASLGHDSLQYRERSDDRHLVGCRLLDVVDHEDIDGTLGQFQL